ncbi:unnamed protein product [Musa hybrid cultivar]
MHKYPSFCTCKKHTPKRLPHRVKSPRSAPSTLLRLQARSGPSGDRHHHPSLRRCNPEEEKRRKKVPFCHARDFLFFSMRGTLRSFDSLHFDRCPLRGFERDATSNSMLLFPLFLLLIPKSGPSCLHIDFRWNLNSENYFLETIEGRETWNTIKAEACLINCRFFKLDIRRELKIDPLYSLRQHLLIMKCSKDST